MDYTCAREILQNEAIYPCVEGKYLAFNDKCPNNLVNVEGVCITKARKDTWYAQYLLEQRKNDGIRGNIADIIKAIDANDQSIASFNQSDISNNSIIGSYLQRVSDLIDQYYSLTNPLIVPCVKSWKDPDPDAKGLVYACNGNGYYLQSPQGTCPGIQVPFTDKNGKKVCIPISKDKDRPWYSQLLLAQQQNDDYRSEVFKLTLQNQADANYIKSISQALIDVSNNILRQQSLIKDSSLNIQKLDYLKQSTIQQLQDIVNKNNVNIIKYQIITASNDLISNQLDTIKNENETNLAAAQKSMQTAQQMVVINEGFGGLRQRASDATDDSIQNKQTLYDSIMQQNKILKNTEQDHIATAYMEDKKKIHIQQSIEYYDSWNYLFIILYYILFFICVYIIYSNDSFTFYMKLLLGASFLLYPWVIHSIEMNIYSFGYYLFKLFMSQPYPKTQ